LHYYVTFHRFFLSLPHNQLTLHGRQARVITGLLRELQILVNNHNFVYKNSTVSCLLFTVLGGAISLYASLSLGNFLSTERKFIYGTMSFDVFFVMMLLFGILGSIHEASESLLHLLKDSFLFMSKPENRRVVRSCPVLKIYLGDSNFVERVTPLHCQSFMLQRTVDLTLLTRNQR